MADISALVAEALPRDITDTLAFVLKFDPGQPRVPAGHPGGGQWTRDSFGAATPAEFIAARDRSQRGQFLSASGEEDLRDHTLRVGFGGKVGYALAPDGDLQNVFNNGGPKGAGGKALVDAIKSGATTLDAYDGFLPNLYSRFGFEPVGRMPFNDAFAPAGWDYAKYGRPDVVFMAYRGGARDTIEQRVGTFAPYREGAGRAFDDWDAAKRASRDAVVAKLAGRGRARVGADDSQQRRSRDVYRELDELSRRLAGLSGFLKFDPSQPRDPDGKWTDTGAVRPGMGFMRAEADRVARQFGLDPARIKITDEAPDKFTVGGREMEAAGGFNVGDGTITIFAKAAPKASGFTGLVAHEVSHAKWQDAWGAYQADRARLLTDPDYSNIGGVKLPADVATKYPAFDRINKHVYGHETALAADDGVTPYSEAYWRSIDSGGSSFRLALNETLAEVTRLRYERGNYRGVSDRWRDFHRDVIGEVGKHDTAKYSSDQPRDPKGSSTGGRWTSQREMFEGTDLGRAPEEERRDMTWSQLGIEIDDEAAAILEENGVTPYDARRGLMAGYDGSMKVKKDSWGSGVIFDMELVDEDGVKFADMTRTLDFDGNVATHGYLDINRDKQGAGVAKELLSNQIDFYKNTGYIDRVELTANISAGGYAWAKYGFTPDETSWGHMQETILQRAGDNLGESQFDAIKRLVDGDDPRAMWAVADTVHGKTLLAGTEWNGFLDLDDTDSMRRFNAYVRKGRK